MGTHHHFIRKNIEAPRLIVEVLSGGPIELTTVCIIVVLPCFKVTIIFSLSSGTAHGLVKSMI
jgi:hypothetical protein